VFPGHTNTGIIATYSGEILTCECHVLNERGLELPVSVKFSDGSIRSGRAHDDEDNKYDLTRVRMNEPLPRLERIPRAAGKPTVGQRCLVLGYSMGEPECRIEEARMGGVDQMRTNAGNKTVRHMQLDGLKYFAPGQAVLDENGSFIGITCAELVNGSKKPEWRADTPLAVPVEVLRNLMQK
jgi:hypothetical protein